MYFLKKALTLLCALFFLAKGALDKLHKSGTAAVVSLIAPDVVGQVDRMLSRANFTVYVQYMCPHTSRGVSSYYCMCPHTPGWAGGQNAVARQLCVHLYTIIYLSI